jgi:hypothetical protein
MLGRFALSSRRFPVAFPEVDHYTVHTQHGSEAVESVSIVRIDGRMPCLTAHRRLFWI